MFQPQFSNHMLIHQAGIDRSLQGANGPHWCEDPMLDRQNPLYKMTRALIRMRKACYPLQSAADLPAKAVSGGEEELAYWKLPVLDENETLPEEQPKAMLVVLRMVDTPSLEHSKYLFPELPGGYAEGQAFVDLFDASRLAVVFKDENQTFLLVPGNLALSHVAIFAPMGSVILDEPVGDWSVCKGVALPHLEEYSCEAQSNWFPMWGTLSTSIIWILAVVAILAINSRTSIYLSVVMEPTAPNICQPAGLRVEPRHILVAAIEHTIPERNVKANGVVCDSKHEE